MELEAIFFDYDGTIVDSREIYRQIYQEKIWPVLSKSRLTDKKYYKYSSPDLRKMHKKLGFDKQKSGIATEIFVKETQKLKIEPFDGINELFDYLRKNGLIIAVISANHRNTIKENLEKNMLEVDYIAGSVKKPNPTKLIEAIKDLETTVEKSCFVGDTTLDILMGKNAGISTTIAVTYGFEPRKRLKKADPDYIINYPTQLIGVIND